MGGGEIGEGVGEAGDIVFGHLIAAVAAADGDRHPRAWQTGDLAGETGRRLGQKIVVNTIQAAGGGDHVGAAGAVVGGHHQQVEISIARFRVWI